MKPNPKAISAARVRRAKERLVLPEVIGRIDSTLTDYQTWRDRATRALTPVENP